MKAADRGPKVPKFVIDDGKAIMYVVKPRLEAGIDLDTALLGAASLTGVDFPGPNLEKFQYIIINLIVFFGKDSNITGDELRMQPLQDSLDTIVWFPLVWHQEVFVYYPYALHCVRYRTAKGLQGFRI
ncbi:hypothetical protein BGV54_06945 [Burkholderia ubonensis]|nr:hypothetical protein WL36_22245 [Burkholderia ubonensis]KWC42979.1 hypothetical protein WL52_28480 [Burkholderia ubonensis]KWI75256.1 hypothetical protein WM07_06520 [Burkholderia ubonensis]KWN73892.1 hypothetical protein WM24_32845 [Burkholderia ubonensis]OJB25089.1 hypothetical protein BGV54_06945 [Burkholderia ubonensis]